MKAYFAASERSNVFIVTLRSKVQYSLHAVFIHFFPVRFHIAHLYEVQGKYKTAKENYEQLLKEKDLPTHLKADICRQLGEWTLGRLIF